MYIIEFVIFVLISILLLVFTVIKRSHRHRFPRFFTFESFLVLVLLNSRSWFLNPWSLRQLFSWIFLLGSCVLAFHGFRLLIIVGSPKDDFEETTKVITKGAYRYIRHPLYCTFILAEIGAFLKDPSFLGLTVFLILICFVFITAKIEEGENIEKFGDEYRAYMDTTKMFIPFLI